MRDNLAMKGFPEITKKFGFGCMRLPTIGEDIDIEQCKKMADLFLAKGFTYFDTARPYHRGKSETALKEFLTSRHARNEYTITNKLTEPYFNKREDIRPFFESQLEACGVDYFDFYLMHAQNANNYKKFKACQAYEESYQLLKEGKIRHLGLSFHDSAEVLEMILKEHPEVEIVQLQLNYLDYDDPSVQSRKCYDVCLKYDKPVIVMEPVKGGKLVNLPPKAQTIIDGLKGGSNASYAIRFAASHESVKMVLSGMSNLSQMEDNVSFMEDFKPLNEKEILALKEVVEIFKKMELIECTGCRYCIDENKCPKNIAIPMIFDALNDRIRFGGDDDGDYRWVTSGKRGKASECLKCGLCEKVCPQHLPIREYLARAAKEFEK